MKQKPSLYKKLKRLKPWQIIAGLVGVILIAIYFYNILGTSDVVLDISSTSNKVVVGVPFEIKASVKNISRIVLSDTKLSLSLPTGLIFDGAPNLRIRTIDLGVVGANGNHEESFMVVAIPTANVNAAEPVASLTYSRGSVRAVFEQKAKISLEIADLGLDLQLNGPEKVTSGEPFDLKAIYTRNSLYTSETENIPSIKLQFDYPAALTATYSLPQSKDKSALPKKLNDRTFLLGALKPADSGEINLKGIIDLPEGSSFKITANILINIMGRDYTIVTKDFSAILSPSPLSVALYAGANSLPTPDSAKAVLNTNDTVNYLLVYKNQSDIAFENIILKVKLIGAMYDFGSSPAGNGLWNQAIKTIIWDSSNVPEFKSLAPGTTGNINFAVKIAPDYPIRRINDKNFTVRAEARIESPTVRQNVGSAKTSSSFTLENRISGKIKVEALGFFRDAPALILNNGPWPPKVNTPTDFTIHWVLTNYSTDLTNVEVRGDLPDGYVFTGQVKSNIASAPQFDADKGEIIWKIDKLYATAGITSDKPEAIFQVRVTPANVGDYAPILGTTTATATDTFTGLQIIGVDDAITTRLPDDPSVHENEGKVVN